MASFITAGNATNGLQVSSDNTGILQLKTGTGSGTTAVTVDASQNVGIGTSSPVTDSITFVRGAGRNAILDLVGNGNTPNTTGLSILQGTDNNAYIYNRANAGIIFGSNNTERARITSTGDLLVGTTTSGAGTVFDCKLTVTSNAVNPAVFKWDGTALTAYPLRTWNNATSGNNIFVDFATEASYTSRGSIDYNRGAGQVRYNATSDARLKNIIGDADGQKSVEILNSTRIREYAWKDDEQQKPQIGVIAQELYETYKGAVSVGGDIEKTDAEGNVTTEYRPWGVDKTAFTFHLIAGWQAHEKMIQELNAKVEAQAAEIAALKGNA